MNKLQIINRKDVSSFEFNIEEMDHLIGSIEDFKKESGRYPNEIVMNKEFGRRYLNKYKQGVPVRILYKNKPMHLTINTRLRASNIFMR
jgi:hypothetical protein